MSKETDEDGVKYDPQTGKNRDTETGAFVAEHTDEDFIEAVNELWPDEFPTTQRVADEVGISRRGAYNYLSKLDETGALKSRDSGSTKVWMPVDG